MVPCPTQVAEVDLAALTDGRNLELTLARSSFEDMCEDLFERCMDAVHRLLSDERLAELFHWSRPSKVLFQIGKVCHNKLPAAVSSTHLARCAT